MWAIDATSHADQVEFRSSTKVRLRGTPQDQQCSLTQSTALSIEGCNALLAGCTPTAAASHQFPHGEERTMIDEPKLSQLLYDPQARVIVFGLAHVNRAASAETGAARLLTLLQNL